MIFISFMQPILPWLILGSLMVAILGINKRMGFWGYLFSSLLMSPFVGLLLVLVSADATDD